MHQCIFCRIAAGELPAERLLETPTVVAFRDLNPQAPQHLLVIPRRHIASLDSAQPEDHAVLADLLAAGAEVARLVGIAETGYRAVINCNGDGGQTVYHLHLHIIGGRSLRWPPG